MVAVYYQYFPGEVSVHAPLLPTPSLPLLSSNISHFLPLPLSASPLVASLSLPPTSLTLTSSLILSVLHHYFVSPTSFCLWLRPSLIFYFISLSQSIFSFSLLLSQLHPLSPLTPSPSATDFPPNVSNGLPGRSTNLQEIVGFTFHRVLNDWNIFIVRSDNVLITLPVSMWLHDMEFRTHHNTEISVGLDASRPVATRTLWVLRSGIVCSS